MYLLLESSIFPTFCKIVPIFDVIFIKAVCEIGYTSSDMGFDGNTCAVMTSIDKQSPDIAMGVDNSVPIFDVIFIFFTNLLKINFTFNHNLNLIFAKY